MSWNLFSAHFKHSYEQGYRYLDRCGEFMVEAVERFDFLSSEVKVTGARLEIPEKGLNSTVDTAEATVSQDLPDDNGDFFLQSCKQISGLVSKYFAPKRTIKNGFAIKLFWPVGSAELALAASLKFGGSDQTELAKSIGMIPSRKHLDYNFTSGSSDFHVSIQPITFEKVSLHKHNSAFDASPEEQRRINRLNMRTQRVRGNFSHAVMMDLDLIEFSPPEDSLEKHFYELRNKAEILKKGYLVT